MPASRKSRKRPNGASKTDKITIEKILRSNNQTNIPASPFSDPFKDPDSSTGTPNASESNKREVTRGEGCSKPGGRKARKDDEELGSDGSGAKSSWTMKVETAILELRETVIALDSITRECIARHNDLERDGEIDAGKLSILEELVTFLAFKMDAHLEIVNHIRVLGHRPAVTAEELYRAGLWPHDISLGESGNGNQEPPPTDLPNTGTDHEPSPSSKASCPLKDDAVALMNSRPDESTAPTKADSETKIPIATLLNDGPPNRYQRSSQPSQDYDAEKKARAKIPTVQNHKDFLSDIGHLKKQALELCLKVAKYNDSSAVLADMTIDRSTSIASIERRVGLMYLVSRLHVGDQKAPDDNFGNLIRKEVSITGEGPRVKALIDAVLLDDTNLRNENDARITSLDNVTHSQLDGKLTREGSSISEPQGGLSEERIEETSTTAQNISQNRQLYKEEDGNSRGSLKYLSAEAVDTSIDKRVHKVMEGQKIPKADAPKAGPQQDGIEEIIKLLQLLVGEANGSEGLEDGSSGERACASTAEAFLRILATSWTEQNTAMGGEMLEDFKKENAYLIEKLKILAAVDLQIEDSRLKVGVMQDAVEPQLGQISSPANDRSTSQGLVEDVKPNQDPIKVDDTKRNDSSERSRPQDLADRTVVAAPSHDIWRHPIPIEEGITASGRLKHEASKHDASFSTVDPKPNSADILSGLLATEDAALVLTSMKAQGQGKPRQPPLVDSIEDRQPTKNDVHDKSTSQDLSSSEDIWRTSQPGKQDGGGVLQGQTLKTKPQVEFKRAVIQDFHDVIILNPLKDPPQPGVDTSDQTPPDVAEDEGKVKDDRERKHDGKPREDLSSAQPGANDIVEIPPGLNDSNRDSGLIANEKDEKWDKLCLLEDIANEKKAAESEVSDGIIKLTAQSEIFKEEESVVSANFQEEPSCRQFSSTAENPTVAASDEDYGADSKWQVRRRGKTATLYAPKEVEYNHYGCDHPFL